MPEIRSLLLLPALLALGLAAAGDDSRHIVFLPPPMDGTISLGITDAAGRIVRVLHREAEEKDFKVGENGFITSWDGRDEAGQQVPPGKYSAGGWSVGDLGIEGVAFHGNDWIKDESPRFTRVTSVKTEGRDEVRVTLRTADGRDEMLAWNLAREGATAPETGVTAEIADGQLMMRKGGASRAAQLAAGEKPLACATGFGDRVWTIVETGAGREVRAYTPEGEFLRRLGYAPDEPQPVQVAASQWSEMIFLLEENATEQRVRSLALGAPAAQPDGGAGKSEWRVTYLKRIRKSDTFDAIAPHLGGAKPPVPEPVVKLKTRPNPLLDDERSEISLKVKVDAEGALLITGAGLPLVRLTTAENLKWAVLARREEGLSLFQGDGVVVEEFRIKKPENMMSFDAGDIEVPPAGAKPAKQKPAPEGTPKRKKPLRPGDDL